jgi:hypothetical protein
MEGAGSQKVTTEQPRRDTIPLISYWYTPACCLNQQYSFAALLGGARQSETMIYQKWGPGTVAESWHVRLKRQMQTHAARHVRGGAGPKKNHNKEIATGESNAVSGKR